MNQDAEIKNELNIKNLNFQLHFLTALPASQRREEVQHELQHLLFLAPASKY